MNPRKMIADAGYHPEAVAALTQAYEEAWSIIASRHAREASQERLRFKIAGVVMLLGRRLSDPVELGTWLCGSWRRAKIGTHSRPVGASQFHGSAAMSSQPALLDFTRAAVRRSSRE